MHIPPKMPDVTSIALDELNATYKRLEIIANNSENPVERMLAIQLAPVIEQNIHAAIGLLSMPDIENKAEAFCKEIDSAKSGN